MQSLSGPRLLVNAVVVWAQASSQCRWNLWPHFFISEEYFSLPDLQQTVFRVRVFFFFCRSEFVAVELSVWKIEHAEFSATQLPNSGHVVLKLPVLFVLTLYSVYLKHTHKLKKKTGASGLKSAHYFFSVFVVVCIIMIIVVFVLLCKCYSLAKTSHKVTEYPLLLAFADVKTCLNDERALGC